MSDMGYAITITYNVHYEVNLLQISVYVDSYVLDMYKSYFV